MQIPVIRASGSHYEVGLEVGRGARAALEEMHAATLKRYGERWPFLLALSRQFLTITEDRLPRVVEELQGCAAGSGVPFDDLFLMSIEELLNEEVRGTDTEEWVEGHAETKGCSDLAAAPPATADGRVWLAHNNDLSRPAQEHLFVTRLCATGEPEVMAVTVGGIFISIGLNRAGISLTGNQLYANDSRVGVPRLLVVRDILAQDSFEDAVQSALLPERASSYNNLIGSADGRLVNVEGSAIDCELIPAEEGATCHTNHYVAPRMKRYEQADYYVSPSEARSSRASDYIERHRGEIDFDICARFLRDHVFSPWSVCKHTGDGVTVFSAIINLTDRELWLTRGNPCESEYEPYRFQA